MDHDIDKRRGSWTVIRRTARGAPTQPDVRLHVPIEEVRGFPAEQRVRPGSSDGNRQLGASR